MELKWAALAETGQRTGDGWRIDGERRRGGRWMKSSK